MIKLNIITCLARGSNLFLKNDKKGFKTKPFLNLTGPAYTKILR